jgi:WD40 repeat protein
MADPSAHVATFYSFKGGVGRSLLLANVGWRLAERRRVLLWDLDVEAPGLHRIPALRPPEVKRGFFEWLGDWKGEEALRKKGALSKREAAALQRLVLPVPGRPNLSILPAFGDAADFARLYAEGPWRRLLVDEPSLGLALFDAVLAVLTEGRDHLLIDSRTGITDVGGFLAALLPHATVLVGGYGHQSLQGTLHVWKALEPAVAGKLVPRDRLGSGAGLRLVHVVSPVPEDVEDSAERRRIWGEVFGSVKPIEVPFDQRLLWSERLLVEEDAEGATGKAYGQVAARLASLREELLARSEAASTEATRRPEAAQALDSDPRLGARGLPFEARVHRLLELHGYTVEGKQLLGGNEVDLVARITGGLDEQCWWVECKDHQKPVGKDVLEKLKGWIDGNEGKRQRARGMVVARGFSAAAVSYAADRPDLRAWTVDDLERRLFDPRPYLQGLVSAFEQGLGRTYVEQQVLLEGRAREEAARADLLPHALAWAGGEGPRLWLVLGDYGTGKSTFFQRFAAELARRALADPEAPFPLAIDLKEYPNATSAETLFFEHLRRKVPGFRGDPAALLHLLAAGRCVLLLDAFDEMGVAAASRSIEQQFRELARLAGEEPLDARRGGRVLITCRTHFFRDQQQVKDTASGRLEGLGAAQDSTLGRIARRFNAAIDEVCLFEDEQIDQFLEKHLGSEAAKAREFIDRTYDLPRLAPRPVLLEMIVRSLPALWKEGEERVTSAGLYEVYTRQWLEDRSGRNLQTPPVLRHRLLALLAATLWRREDRQLHHSDLLAEVRRWSGHFQGLDHQRLDVELRTAAFLVRSAEGYYRFSHKSFLEYFLARRLWDVLATEDEAAEALDLPALSPEIGEFFWQLPEDRREERLKSLRAVLQRPYRPRASENALRLGAWASRHDGGEAFRLEGAQLADARLAGEDLSGLKLPGANLSGAQLEGCQAIGTDLTRALLTAASLVGADLSAAMLPGADLDDAVLRGAMLDRTDFSSASLLRADLSAASGHATVFEHADMSQARLDASTWTEARFRGASVIGTATLDWLLAAEQDLPASLSPGRLSRHEPRVKPRVGHRSWVRSLAWSPDGQLLASASDDGSVQLWEAATGETVRVLAGAGGSVWSVSWSSKGSLLASGSSDGSVRLWNTETGEVVRVLSEEGGRVRSVSWSPNGCLLASGSFDGAVRLWNTESGEAGRGLARDGGSILSVSWSPDGRLLAASSEDGSVSLWQVETGQVQTLAAEGGRISSISWSPDGSLLATGSEDGAVRLRRPETGETVRLLTADGGRILSISWSPEGSVLASGSFDGLVRLWQIGATGESVRILPGSAGSVWAVAWSPDGRLLASGNSTSSVRLWQAADETTRVLAGNGGSIWSISWSPNGKRLAVGSEDGSVRLWQAETGEAVQVLAGDGGSVWVVTWSPDGCLLASGSFDGMVRLWRAETGETVGVLAGDGGSVLSVSWSPNGRLLASGSFDGSVRLWQTDTGEVARTFAGRGGRVLSVSWSPDGDLLATGSEDGSVRLWQADTGEVVRALTHSAGSVWSLSWSPDGRLLASGNDGGSVHLWQAATGKFVRALTRHGGRVLSVTWSPDGSLLASGSDDGSVRLWQAATGEIVRSLTGYGGGVLSVSWSPDGSLLASGGHDGSVLLQGTSAGELRGIFSSFAELNVATAPGGWFLQSPPSLPLDPRRYRLLVSPRTTNPDRGWRVLPLGGLARYLQSPERVRAALAGESQPPPVLPGAAEPDS